MQEILTLSIPIPWPNSALTLAVGNILDSNQMNPIDRQRSLARFSLKTGAKILGHHLSDAPVLHNYKNIEGATDLTCSLSHTSGPHKTHNSAVGGSFMARQFGSGVGIDLEWAHRPMREDAYARFAHAGDHASWKSSEELLWSWMVKEACFKAASNTWGNQITLINQIKLPNPFSIESSGSIYSASGSCMGEVGYRLLQNECSGHPLRIAIAIVL